MFSACLRHYKWSLKVQLILHEQCQQRDFSLMTSMHHRDHVALTLTITTARQDVQLIIPE